MRIFKGISLTFLLCMILLNNKFAFSETIAPLQTPSTENVSELKQDVYSKIKCCECNVSFDKCTCPEAKEMKAYIDALVESGVKKEEIFYKVAKKFSLKTILDPQLKQELEKKIASEAGESRPQIALETTLFDFGQVSKSQGKVHTIFKLSNKGTVSLFIKNLKASCSCTTISLTVGKEKSPYFDNKGAPIGWQMEIKPGEMADLEVVLDLAHKAIKPGEVTREVMIISNDPLYPESVVRVEAKVSEGESGFSGELVNGIRVIEVKASKFKFEPDPIVVKQGEKVRLVATSTDVKHGLAIPEFKVNVVTEVGKTSTVEFIADKTGEFRTHCSVFCGIGHGNMQGTLVVKK